MTSHPDPSVLSALLRDREREAIAMGEEVAALRAEVERLRARDARTTNRWENAECVLGYYKGLPIARIVRERDEHEAIAGSAMREGLAECKRLRASLRTLREHVRWYLEVHKDRPGKQNSRQNEHDRECSKMLLWQWVKFGEPTKSIDAPLADDERLRQEVERLRRFERDAWIAMENHVARLEVFDAYARALREHEAHKGDPTRNVATGTALYAAEAAMRKLALEETC